MYKNLSICSAILLIVFGLSVAPALGIQATVNTKGVTAKTNCDLENSAQFYEKTVGGSGTLYQKAQMSGTGDHFIEKTTSGYGYEVISAFRASGAANSYMTTVANADGATMNSQTGISGGVGHIASSSSTGANYMGVTGGFKGEGGYLSSDITSAAFNGERAYTGGSASMLGVQCLDEEVSMGIASNNDKILSADGIYAASDGNLGDFGMFITNTEKVVPSAIKSRSTSDESSGYILTPWKLDVTTENPVQIYLAMDSIPDYLVDDTGTVSDNILAATQTWNVPVQVNLFAERIEPFEGSLPKSPSSQKFIDEQFVHAWKDLGKKSPTIAVTWTWYDTSSGYAIDSDCYYNTNYQWYTATDEINVEGGKVDVRTIALHELGHTAGLGDLYDYDNRDQVMYGYHDVTSGEVDWTLGDGDKEGIFERYRTPP